MAAPQNDDDDVVVVVVVDEHLSLVAGRALEPISMFYVCAMLFSCFILRRMR